MRKPPVLAAVALTVAIPLLAGCATTATPGTKTTTNASSGPTTIAPIRPPSGENATMSYCTELYSFDTSLTALVAAHDLAQGRANYKNSDNQAHTLLRATPPPLAQAIPALASDMDVLNNWADTKATIADFNSAVLPPDIKDTFGDFQTQSAAAQAWARTNCTSPAG